MGKKSKVGKQRKDRYYHLAKETGYRSRAAFKLLQLNRKFEFLQRARVLVDLCAAPGGWMQVAKQNMPVSSVVIGVDMYPMKSVPGCISLLEDITTEKCRVSLKKELKTWKADVFLHDGAPNLGKNWIQDAYDQTCLTLSALKLSCQFLKKDGWFITKLFRSKDYNSVLWVLKQLFKKVHATKPQASRNESAEIYVVCERYLDPASVDKRFFDANHVFKDVDNCTLEKVDGGAGDMKALMKSAEKIRKEKAVGYADDAVVLHERVNVSDFMAADNPVKILQNVNEIVLNDLVVAEDERTTREIKDCCADVKVLGKKELRALIAWWKAFRPKVKEGESEGKNEREKVVEEVEMDGDEEEDKELDEVAEQIRRLEDEERREGKRKRKRANKERTKLRLKMNLRMASKDDIGPVEEGDGEMFRLSEIATSQDLNDVTDQLPDHDVDSDQEPKGKRVKRVKYSKENTFLDKSGMFYRSDNDTDDDDDDEKSDDDDKEGLGLRNSDDESVRRGLSNDEDDAKNSHPLITDLDDRTPADKRSSKVAMWFGKEMFKNVEKEDDEDFELDKMACVVKSKGGEIMGEGKEESGDVSSDEDSSDESEEEEEVAVMKPVENCKGDGSASKGVGNLNEWDVDEEDKAVKRRKKKEKQRALSAEQLALGTLIATSRKNRRDISDSGWNRYAFNDENLPEWFAEEEKKFMRKDIQVPPELVEEYAKSREEMNVRPIKKVAEAKARRKKRAARRLEKAKKKMEGLMENPDSSNADKAKQIKQIYKKLSQNNRPEVKYVVAKKHTAAAKGTRLKGVKGPYKVVDSRMKKDLRGKIKKQTKNKSKKTVKKVKKSFKPKRKNK